MESDRNATNWSLIRRSNGNYDFAPIYDCSTMARLNNDVSQFSNKLYDENVVYNLTDGIKQSLSLDNENDSENFLSQFRRFCVNYPEFAEKILSKIGTLNVDDVMFSLPFTIPYDIEFWIRKSINLRLNEMKSIYKNSKTNKTRVTN